MVSCFAILGGGGAAVFRAGFSRNGDLGEEVPLRCNAEENEAEGTSCKGRKSVEELDDARRASRRGDG